MLNRSEADAKGLSLVRDGQAPKYPELDHFHFPYFEILKVHHGPYQLLEGHAETADDFR